MQRLTELAIVRGHRGLFTRTELANWIRGTVDVQFALLKRAIAAKEVVRVHRGLYCLSARYREEPIDSFVVAQYLLGPSYVSLESALAFHGWIPEAVETVTSVGMERSRTIQTPIGRFRFVRVPQVMLFDEVHRIVRRPTEAFFVASPLKALADYVYVHRCDWDTPEPVIGSLRVDRDQLESIDDEAIEGLTRNYRSRRVVRFLEGLRGRKRRCRSA